MSFTKKNSQYFLASNWTVSTSIRWYFTHTNASSRMGPFEPMVDLEPKGWP